MAGSDARRISELGDQKPCRNAAAIGTAVAALEPPFSTKTANAMSPRQPMVQACVSAGLLSNSAVPVLA